ncbi:MAG TPA: DUF4252 domain-containing protein [Acidobacteriaceae bacterium]
MTKMMKATQLILAAGMVSGLTAMAQPAIMSPVANLVDGDVRVSGLNLQTSISMNVSYQAKDDFFKGTERFAQGASDVTEVNLDPNTMGMVGKSKGKDGEMARKMKTMSIHTYKYDKPGMYRMEDVETYRKKLEDGSWNCSIHTRNKNGSTDICSRTASDHETNEMVILTAEPQKLTFIHMKGNMSLDELNGMNDNDGDRHRDENPRPPRPPKPPKEPKTPKVPKDSTMPAEPVAPTPPTAPTAPTPPAQ